MPQKGVDQKPSETALFAALRRALAHTEYAHEKFGPDHLANTFMPPHFRFFLKFKKIQADTAKKLEAALPGLNAYMIARTVWLDALFFDELKNKVPQIVLMGAGYDSRAFRFAAYNHGTTVFELDAAPTQERKLACLKKARIPVPQGVKFIPINFNKQSLESVLDKAGFDRSLKTLFIWEGVSYYLEPESVDATLASIHQLGAEGSLLAFDYTVTVPDDKLDVFFGVRLFNETMKQHHASEALLFSIEEDQTENFLTQRGFKLLTLMDNTKIERAFLTRDDGSLIGPITGHFRFVVGEKQDK
jgi:methyltransferase (TIGR00027 family)